jgi:hypothetical protein
MAIINPQPQAPSLPPVEELAKAVRAEVSNSINGLFGDMLKVYNSCMSLVWQHPTLSPQQVLDAYGSDAAELFRLAATLKGAVNAAVAGTIPDNDTPKPFTINEDGTVTVGG